MCRTQCYSVRGTAQVEDDSWEGGVLKLEVFIIQQLQKLRDTVKLYDSGKRDKYCFMVMTLCGKDLMTLKRLADRPFSESTTLRLAISTLYAIKQVHEIGYVHRDVKPGNCMIGKYGRDTRMIYLIDFGMARSFVAKDDSTGKLAIRKPREGDQLFRGTPRYCSLNTHYRKEQGRVDDLWAWLYMLVELHIGLPWNRIGDEKTCPKEFFRIYDYLKTLKYEDRPDYYGLFSECSAGLKRVHGSFLDRYEWEMDTEEEVATALSISDADWRPHRPLGRTKLAHKSYPFTTKAVFERNLLML
ncbi:hypothetical protein Aduo_011431 [Ancylostoma duodenale]